MPIDAAQQSGTLWHPHKRPAGQNPMQLESNNGKLEIFWGIERIGKNLKNLLSGVSKKAVEYQE